MSGRKLLGIRFVVLALILLAVAIAFPALAHDKSCPEGYDLIVPVPPGEFGDNNGDSQVCAKSVPGNGNAGDGRTTRDNHTHAP